MSLKRNQLPRYQGKENQVLALKIKEVRQVVDGAGYIVPEDDFYPEFQVSGEYMSKYHPKEGGYYVELIHGDPIYMDAKDFSKQYTLMK